MTHREWSRSLIRGFCHVDLALFNIVFIYLRSQKDGIKSNMVRWPSWLWRQVKVILTHIPGHESGVGSSPTLISIRLASVRYPRFFFCRLLVRTVTRMKVGKRVEGKMDIAPLRAGTLLFCVLEVIDLPNVTTRP